MLAPVRFLVSLLPPLIAQHASPAPTTITSLANLRKKVLVFAGSEDDFKKETPGLIEIPQQNGAGKTCRGDALAIAEAIWWRWEKASGGVGDGPVCGGLSLTNLRPPAPNTVLGLSFSHSSSLPSLGRLSHLRENKQAVSFLHYSPGSPPLQP